MIEGRYNGEVGGRRASCEGALCVVAFISRSIGRGHEASLSSLGAGLPSRQTPDCAGSSPSRPPPLPTPSFSPCLHYEYLLDSKVLARIDQSFAPVWASADARYCNKKLSEDPRGLRDSEQRAKATDLRYLWYGGIDIRFRVRSKVEVKRRSEG